MSGRPTIIEFLASHADGRGWATAGTYDIAEATGIPRKVVRRLIAEYIRLGLLDEGDSAWGVYRVQLTERSGFSFGRVPITKRMREAVIDRDGLICRICGWAVATDDLHIDHVHPVIRGGRTILQNLQVTHSRCNLSKGSR